MYNVYCSLYANYTPSLEGQSNQFLINENNDTTEVVFVRKIKINFSDAANHLRRSYDILKDRIQEIPYLFEALDGVSYPDSGANYFKVVFNMKIGDPNTLMWRMAAILYEIGLDEFLQLPALDMQKFNL
ncbi:MAG: hypothetical protein HWD59_15285 [Coxiellaceae bacterium]|nr:MAG: hypothetical protein HWD59_15285 [Coxiellaceae bacterium]